MNNKCENCNLYFSGYCFCEDEPEQINGEVLRCDYYINTNSDLTFKNGFINGFQFCNTMKKVPAVKKIEDRARNETIEKIINIIRWSEYLSGDIKDKLNQSIMEAFNDT